MLLRCRTSPSSYMTSSKTCPTEGGPSPSALPSPNRYRFKGWARREIKGLGHKGGGTTGRRCQMASATTTKRHCHCLIYWCQRYHCQHSIPPHMAMSAQRRHRCCWCRRLEPLHAPTQVAWACRGRPMPRGLPHPGWGAEMRSKVGETLETQCSGPLAREGVISPRPPTTAMGRIMAPCRS